MLAAKNLKQNQIIEYYTDSNWMYKYFWYSKKSLAMHYGFWDEQTINHDQALINQYTEIIRLGKITAKSKVLDAGCGVGGASIYIAKYTDATVTAITITPLQVKECQVNISQAKLKNVSCIQADFTDTPFPDHSFDVIFGIESICHAYPKSDFLKEAARLLKKDGVLIISDGYCQHPPVGQLESDIVSTFCKGWELHELIPIKKMNAAISSSGLEIVEIIDRTKQVRPTLQKMRLLLLIISPITWLAGKINHSIFQTIYRNTQAMKMSIIGVESGLMGYWTHVIQPK